MAKWWSRNSRTQGPGAAVRPVAGETQLVPRGLAVVTAWTWRVLLLVGAACLVAVALFELRLITVPIFVAILLTTLLLPPVHLLRRAGFPPALATATVFLACIAALAGIVALGSQSFESQFSQFGPQLDSAIESINNWLRTGPLHLTEAQIDEYIRQATRSVRDNGNTLSSGLLSSATLVGELLTGVLISIILTFFFTKDGEDLTDGFIRQFPARHHDVMHRVAHRAFSILSNYLRGIAMTGVVDAVLIGIGLAIIGVPLKLPLIILTFFGAFFPLVGATVAGGIAMLIALVNGGVTDALLVLGVVLLVQQTESHLLQPLLVGRAVSLHPVVIITALVAGGVIAGLLGAFLAVPLTAVAVGVVREVRGHSTPSDPPEVATRT